MEITIFDKRSEVEDFHRQIKLLWGVVPFSFKVNLNTLVSNFLLYSLCHKDLDERTKVDYIKAAIRGWNVKITPEGLEKGYQEYLRVKRMKNKPKDAMLFLTQRKQLMQSFHEEMLKYHEYLEKLFKIYELHSYFSLPGEDGVICLDGLIDYERSEFSSFEVELLSDLVLNEFEIPLFSDDVEKYVKIDNEPLMNSEGEFKKFGEIIKGIFKKPILKENEVKGDSDQGDDSTEKILIFRHKLAKYVSPKSLTFAKLEIVRKELVKAFVPLGIRHQALKAVLQRPTEKGLSLRRTGSFFQMKILPFARNFQKAIDENLYFQQIINSDVEKEEFVLYFCACSVEDLLRLFEKVSKVPKETIEFVKDELKEKIDFKRTTLFLYLKESADGNNDY